jgi:AcrR family transcriptional regulator
VPSPTQAETINWRSYPKDPGLSQVLAASLQVFHEYGYHGTTVRMIATQASMSVPGLYYHFASKQEILVALLKQSNEDLMSRAQAALAEAGDSPRDRFSALVENIILYMAHRRHLAHLAREIKFLEEPYRRAHIARRDELEQMMRREVMAAQKQGQFLVEDAKEVTRAVWVLCRSVADWYVAKGAKTPAEIARTYVDFCHALVRDTKARPY